MSLRRASSRAPWGPVAPLRALGLAVALLGAACGGDADEGLELSVSRLALGAEVTRARLDLHPSDRGCDDPRAAGPGVLGAYVLDIDFATGPGTTEAHQADLARLRPAAYTLAIWGFGSDGGPRAFGCLEDVSVVRGERTRATVTLAAYTR